MSQEAVVQPAVAIAQAPSTVAAAATATLSRAGPELRIRRFGRTDFERFDQEAARGSQLCVGSAQIGKVDIDCRYHWERAQWGVLGQKRSPAGIVYMDIVFRQPQGYWLESATVYVTLSEDPTTSALRPLSHGMTTVPIMAGYGVQITDNFGPSLLRGPKTVQKDQRTTKFAPEIGACGVQLGGMGAQWSKEAETVDSWTFRGTVGRPKNQDGFRTLRWELKENALNLNQIHSQHYSTGFAFEHNARPVYMRVEIEGKLRSKSSQLLHDCLRFSSRLSKKDSSTLTQMYFRGQYDFRKRLDDLASGLDMAMQLENWRRVGMEMPESMPAQFWHGAANENMDSRVPPSLAMPPVENSAFKVGDMKAIEDRDPVLGALARLAQGHDVALLPEARAVKKEDTEDETHILEEAELQPELPRTPGRITPTTDKSSVTVVGRPEEKNDGGKIDDATLVAAMKIPAVVFMIRLLVMIWALFRKQEQQRQEFDEASERSLASVDSGYSEGESLSGQDGMREGDVKTDTGTYKADETDGRGTLGDDSAMVDSSTIEELWEEVRRLRREQRRQARHAASSR